MNSHAGLREGGMDQFLGFVLALLAFAVFIFLISRAVKFVVLLGCALAAYLALVAIGVL